MSIIDHPIRAFRALRGMPYLIGSMVIVGALLGGAVVPAVQVGLEAFDSAHPVVVAHATLLPATSADDVLVHLSGRKDRECQYIGLQAYTRRANDGDTLSDAYIHRVDVPETGATRPRGKFSSLGTWRIWPRGNAGAVLIYAHHSCSGRLVVGKLAEIALPAARAASSS